LLSDHLDEERLACRYVEDVDRARGDRRDDDHPVLRVAAPAEQEQRE